jgi:hypothetical protein
MTTDVLARGSVIIALVATIPACSNVQVRAAEGVPRGWVRDRDVVDDPRCPHEQPSTRATVMIIRRVR